ncbi:MAG: site-specific integrase [Oscillospiraceae bacterium]|jgi:integrase|nr:site-specific integrase [Oscillospiraceae bacterium]
MVAGHLQEKKGFFYIVLSYKDAFNKRKTKWIPTGLTVKGNKKKAETKLAEARKTFSADGRKAWEQSMLFSDFLVNWLDVVKTTVAPTTFASYSQIVKSTLAPYFGDKMVMLDDLRPQDIQRYYLIQLERIKALSVIHYHAVIHKALKYAVKMDLLETNPADKVERPKIERFKASFYDCNEMERLFAISKGTLLEVPVLLGGFYGLRRSEVVGLRWDAIDFAQNTLTINHTVTSYNLNGKRQISAQDSTKTKSSMRTLPLVPVFREKLLAVQAQQAQFRELCGKCYNETYRDYICVNQMGDRFSPDYVTQAFPKLLEKHGLRRIRFHDLRHSCASLLLANGVPMKQIQEWLGHSDFSTTANIYAHLDYNSKLNSAQAMEQGLCAALSVVS